MSVAANPPFGIALHGIGAVCAALCYTPQKRVRKWSWQSYWIVQAAFCWLILPIVGAALTIPDLRQVLAEAPSSAMLKSFLLGALYGVGGMAFGLAIRHVGFSITYGMAIGISCVLGTLAKPLLDGELAAIAGKPGGGIVLGGVAVGALGIGLCGLAGRFKEKDALAQTGGNKEAFNLGKGLLLCVLAGVLSAVYGFALGEGKPISDVADRHGAGEFQGNIVYVFANSGAFLTSLAYCMYLHLRHGTLGELVELPAGGEAAKLPINFSMAILTGCLWYGQFFFYGLGHTRMGAFQFSSWGIHMIMLVLVSAAVGLALREWKGCRPRTLAALFAALAVLAAAVLTLAYGNHVGEQAAQASAPAAATSH